MGNCLVHSAWTMESMLVDLLTGSSRCCQSINLYFVVIRLFGTFFVELILPLDRKGTFPDILFHWTWSKRHVLFLAENSYKQQNKTLNKVTSFSIIPTLDLCLFSIYFSAYYVNYYKPIKPQNASEYRKNAAQSRTSPFSSREAHTHTHTHTHRWATCLPLLQVSA